MKIPMPGPEPYEPMPPGPDLRVDFGAPAPGSANPMPEERRAWYEQRIRDSVDAQAAGGARAAQIFVRENRECPLLGDELQQDIERTDFSDMGYP